MHSSDFIAYQYGLSNLYRLTKLTRLKKKQTNKPNKNNPDQMQHTLEDDVRVYRPERKNYDMSISRLW